METASSIYDKKLEEEKNLYLTASREVEDYVRSSIALLESRRKLSRFLLGVRHKEGMEDSVKYSEQLLEHHNEQLRKIFAL